MKKNTPNMGDGSRFSDIVNPPNMPRHMRIPPNLSGLSFIFILLIVLIIFIPIFIWFGCRIEPGADEFAVLIHKTGKDLPSGEILALTPEQKGIQLEVLPEGRYFRNPYSWDWRLHRVIDIPKDKLGILTRLYGEDLPPGKIIATDDTHKGIVEKVLKPGKYRINPYAYKIHPREDIYNPINIRPGHVGVVISLEGNDVFSNELPSDLRNNFLVEDGMKGITTDVLDPGTYYLNPFKKDVVEVNIQSQRFEMSGKDAINFLTHDGFTVIVEGTIEFKLTRSKVAELTHRVGDMDGIIKKVILPRARGFSRIEGSKYPAINYIMGETRQQFQDNLQADLRTMCAEWGVEIKSVLIRNIKVPDEIASIIREREVAVQDAKKFEQQIEQAKSRAELTKQEMLAVQNKEKVEAETAHKVWVINANQNLRVRVVAEEKNLEVARKENEAASFQAEAILLKAEAQQDVIKMKNEAEASVMAEQVKALSGGLNLARYTFYKKLGPQIKSILSNDGEDGLGGLFTPYKPSSGKEVGK
ncbi:MAG: SPFH domain-containing protein [bacterium]|jgi:regulator of protease activity HflC (stomatin/prohibitin superfamily)|nr:SPFH domain-containing protein [bacterium]